MKRELLDPQLENKLTRSDYKPELQRLAKEREQKVEADKKSNLERAMKDLNVEDRSSSKSGNPFGPYPRNDRQDR